MVINSYEMYVVFFMYIENKAHRESAVVCGYLLL